MIRKLSLTFLLFVVLAFLIAACGGSNDTIPPTTGLNFPPDIIFYNDAPDGTTEEVRFTGTASDNVWVDSVEISFDNGVTWNDAVIEGQGSRVTWYYEAIAAELGTSSTILTRGTDLEGNPEIPAGQPYTKEASTLTSDLESLIASAGTGSTDDVIYLSSGAGGAYGDTGADGLALANFHPITIVGNGFDQTIAMGGISAITASSKTFLATSLTAPYLIRANDDLYLRSLRINGGQVGTLISTAGLVRMTVDDCVIAGQDDWGIVAEDTDGGGDVMAMVTGSLIDAFFTRDPLSHGGIYLESVSYDVDESVVVRQNQRTSALTSAGIYIINGGPGMIRNTTMLDNEKAIWTVNSSPIISTCLLNGSVTPSINNTTTGITISAGTGTSAPAINYNLIQDHTSYGVFVEGGTAPTFFHNTITGNKGSAFIFSGNFATQSVQPILGATNLISTTGFNTILGNSNSSAIQLPANNNILCASGSIGGGPILARNNFWGVTDRNSINQRIDDGPGWPVPGAPDIDAESFLVSDPN